MTARLEPSPSVRAPRKQRSADPAQLGLFDALTLDAAPVVEATMDATDKGAAPRMAKVAAPGSTSASRPRGVVDKPPKRRSRAESEIRTLTEADMPVYPPTLVAAVEQSLLDLPAARVWLTYRDIHDHFGVSRATVARRVKEGLVPRIRLQDGRVLDEGPVRRFDRAQVRWILLAVQGRRSKSE